MWQPYLLAFNLVCISTFLICANGFPQHIDEYYDDGDEDVGLGAKNLEERTTTGPQRKNDFLDLSGFNKCGMPSSYRGGFPINESYETEIGDNPWTVAIYSNRSYIAAGTLIRYDVVLTSADAISNVPRDQLTVHAGIWDRLSSKEVSRLNRTVSRIAAHQKLALTVLSLPFLFRALLINPICVPLPDSVFTETSCRITGWGYENSSPSSSADKQSDILWFRRYAVMTREDCLSNLPSGSRLEANVLCGTDLSNELSPQNAGAGLFCMGQRNILAGVALSSRGWEPANSPSIFLNISYYVDWIKGELR